MKWNQRHRDWEEDTVKCLIRSVQGVYLSASAKNNNIEPLTCLVYVQIWTLALRSRAGRGGNRWGRTQGQQTASIRKTSEKQQQRNKNWTAEQSEKVKNQNNTEWRPLFFSSFQSTTKTSQWTKLMVYIFIFIYLKCIMVQKYRRSAAPRYIYKINTPFRQNKLPQKNLT